MGITREKGARDETVPRPSHVRRPSTPGAETAGGAAKGGSQRKGPSFTPFMLNFWTAGSIEIGRYSTQQQNFGAKIDDKFRTRGLAFGMDTTIRPGLKAGLALGFGADTTEIGSDGSKSSSTSGSATLYASYKIAPSLFLDGLVGYAGLRFDARRFEPNSGGWLTGSRNGHAVFESIVLTSEQKWGAFRFAPYASLTAIQASLDAYAESGDANWALSYARTRSNSLDAAAGLRLGYDIPMGWGVLTPTLRLQYQRMFAGTMMQAMSYSVDPATLFTLEDSTPSRWRVDGAAGFMLKGDNGLQGGLEATTSAGGGGRRGIGMRANVRAAF